MQHLTEQERKKISVKTVTSCRSHSELKGNEIWRWLRLQIRKEKCEKSEWLPSKQGHMVRRRQRGTAFSLGWSGVRLQSSTKGQLTPWLFTHLKKSPLPLRQCQNTFMICLNCHPAAWTHTHTHACTMLSYKFILAHACVERLMEEEKGGFPSRYCLVV